jgi:hypothetical protein
MFQPDNATVASTRPAKLPAATPGWFTDGGSTVARTILNSDFMNILVAELLNVLAAAGISPNKATDNQLAAAIQQIAAGGTGGQTATEAQYGATRLATPTEAAAHASRVLAVDPYALGLALASLQPANGANPALSVGSASAAAGTIGSQGYTERFDGSISQWFTVQLADTGAGNITSGQVVNYPIAFPNKIMRVRGTNVSALAGQTSNTVAAVLLPELLNLSSGRFSIHNTGSTGTLAWMLIELDGS